MTSLLFHTTNSLPVSGPPLQSGLHEKEAPLDAEFFAEGGPSAHLHGRVGHDDGRRPLPPKQPPNPVDADGRLTAVTTSKACLLASRPSPTLYRQSAPVMSSHPNHTTVSPRAPTNVPVE